MLEKLKKYIYSFQYDELSDYGKGIRDLLNLMYGYEDITEEDIIKCVFREVRK